MKGEPKTIEDLTPEIMNMFGDLLKTILPQGLGFSLVLFEFGEGFREMKYVSNAQRQDMLATFESLVAKWKINATPSEN